MRSRIIIMSSTAKVGCESTGGAAKRLHCPAGRLIFAKLLGGFAWGALAVLLLGFSQVAWSAITAEESAAIYEDAVTRFRTGDYRGAIDDLKIILQHNSEDTSARFLLGRAHLYSGNGVAAEDTIKRAQRGGIHSSLVLLPLGRACFLQRKYDQILAEIQPGNEDFRIDTQVYVLRGHTQHVLRDFDAADDSYRKATLLSPDNTPAILGRARLRLAQSDFDGARVFADKAVALVPGEAEPWFVRGEILRLNNKYAEAIEQFSRAIDIDPDFFKARISRAACLLELDKTDDVLSELDRVDSIVPGNFQANYLRSLTLERRGDYALGKAIIDNLAAVMGSIDPKELIHDSADLFVAGAVKFARREYEQAYEFLSLYTETVPGDIGGKLVFAATLLRRGDTASAMRYLQRASKADPSNPQIIALMGAALITQGNVDGAARMFQQAVSLAPEHVPTRTQLALSMLLSGREIEAIDELEAVLKLGTSGPRIGLTLALLRIQRAEFDAALAVTEGVMKRQPESPVSYNLAGVAELGKRNFATARANFQEALARDPTFRPALNNVIELDLLEGDANQATASLETLFENNPRDVDVLMGLSKIAASQGRIVDAIRWLEKLPGRTWVEPNIQLVKLYLRAGKFDDALRLARKLSLDHKNIPAVWEAKGRVELALEKPQVAARSFRRIAELFHKSSPGLFRAAQLLTAARDSEGARELLKTAVELDPFYGPAWVALIDLDIREGNLEQARKHAYEFRRSDPVAGEGLVGDVLIRDERFGLAAQAYFRGFIQEPSAPLLLRLYYARRSAGDAASVLSILESWMTANPEDHLVAQALATAYADLGRTELATAQLEKLLRTQPDNYVVNNNLSLLYLKIGDDHALGLARRAHELAPEAPETADTLGWVMVRSGDVKVGLKYLREAFNRAPRLPEVRYHIGVALAMLGQNETAREELERALESVQYFDGKREASALLTELSK